MLGTVCSDELLRTKLKILRTCWRQNVTHTLSSGRQAYRVYSNMTQIECQLAIITNRGNSTNELKHIWVGYPRNVHTDVDCRAVIDAGVESRHWSWHHQISLMTFSVLFDSDLWLCLCLRFASIAKWLGFEFKEISFWQNVLIVNSKQSTIRIHHRTFVNQWCRAQTVGFWLYTNSGQFTHEMWFQYTISSNHRHATCDAIWIGVGGSVYQRRKRMPDMFSPITNWLWGKGRCYTIRLRIPYPPIHTRWTRRLHWLSPFSQSNERFVAITGRPFVVFIHDTMVQHMNLGLNGQRI